MCLHVGRTAQGQPVAPEYVLRRGILDLTQTHSHVGDSLGAFGDQPGHIFAVLPLAESYSTRTLSMSASTRIDAGRIRNRRLG